MSKKRKYSKGQIDFVKNLVNKGEKVTVATRKMCKEFGLSFDDGKQGRYMRRLMRQLGVTNNTPSIIETDVFKEAQSKKHDKNKKNFIITWAQSETPVHKGLLRNIEKYAEKRDADILVIAGRYKNPSSLEASNKIKTKEKNLSNTWDESILPYLDANRHNLHKYLQVLSDIKIQPTASTPLSGMNSITGLESCIIGHPRMCLTSLPVAEGYPNKLLYTTGACTIPNYTDTKVGKRAEFHHQLGFVIVELDGDIFHIRHVSADKNGDFFDLFYEVKEGVVTECCSEVPAIVFGDLHYGEHDEVSLNVSLDLARKLKAKNVVIHDIIDSYSISHHERRNPFKLLERENNGTWSLEKEIDSVVDFINKNSDLHFVVVRSNHDIFIERWLINEDWRKTTNKKLYLEFANLLAKGEAKKGIIPYILDTRTSNCTTLSEYESFKVPGAEFELGAHGHEGVHGSRATPNQLKTLPMKTITGHTHVPHRIDGHLSVGTLTKLRLGYNKGFSAWMHSNVIIHPNGKAQHINIINGRYTV